MATAYLESLQETNKLLLALKPALNPNGLRCKASPQAMAMLSQQLVLILQRFHGRRNEYSAPQEFEKDAILLIKFTIGRLIHGGHVECLCAYLDLYVGMVLAGCNLMEEARARWRESGAFKKEYRDQLKSTKLVVESYMFQYEDAKWIALGLLTGWNVPDPSVNINQIMGSIL